MARTASTMLELGTLAPPFALADTRGNTVTLDEFAGSPALLVMFLCAHCPYVKHVETELGRLCAEYARKGVACVGICSNDADAYPDDAPAGLARQAAACGFTFPYLVDATQAVARDYRAACTPDFFLFDRQRRLVYRGQLDASRPGNDVAVSGSDLRAALDAVLAGRAVSAEQRPSLGCNIKWKPGNEPDYFGAS
ncbi:MAG TPA: thioredoxin family protein [Candidatus Polarisedimenticolaceae bacterium]|nr:thioredoxin family protein [Candidatus Polarisedimenticolaceae bacterium]